MIVNDAFGPRDHCKLRATERLDFARAIEAAATLLECDRHERRLGACRRLGAMDAAFAERLRESIERRRGILRAQAGVTA